MNASRILYLNGKPDTWTRGFIIFTHGRGFKSLRRFLALKGIPLTTAAGTRAWNLPNKRGSESSFKMTAPKLP